LNFILSSLLFYGLPAAYLLWRQTSKIRQILRFSLLFGPVGALFFDYFATLDNTWRVPSIFSFKVLAVVPIEDMVWATLVTMCIVSFYEYFFGENKMQKRLHRIKNLYFLFALLFSLTVAFGVFRLQPVIPHFYLYGWTIFLLAPLVAFIYFWPRYFEPIAYCALYFIPLALLEEIVSLRNGYWYFEGSHYYGWVSMFSYHFPVEELIVWVLFSCPVVLAYYLFFTDHGTTFSKYR
jgi:hypothetical protein